MLLEFRSQTFRKWGEKVDRLVTVKGMRDRYDCSLPTARKYLRQCVPHMENPLVAPEWAVDEWEASRLSVPAGISKEIRHKMNQGRTIVPRKR